MLPLSLSPFLALPGIKHPRTIHFVFFGLASFLLMLLWLVIAERHRQLQNRSRNWITAIERLAQVRPVAARPGRHIKAEVRWARRVLTFAVPALWIAAGFYWPR